ncbi:hypothetical protein NDU88_001327 [Pleurodeles waltl]|uniref:Uncharacterized protein n=1 Tax=Pleurodeles waltl TaxID=8319 RepID=A0AAV7P7L6_PLEWA|nr:hypothetical protein NDU88_001327 [Pleurodeles waltl]
MQRGQDPLRGWSDSRRPSPCSDEGRRRLPARGPKGQRIKGAAESESLREETFVDHRGGVEARCCRVEVAAATAWVLLPPYTG